jgi:hypothetical protein
MIKIFKMPSLVCRAGSTLWPVPEDKFGPTSLIEKRAGFASLPFFLNRYGFYG